MTERPFDSGEEADLLAGEYALGLLEGDDLAEAQRRSLRDPGFAARVERWNVRLEPMLAQVPTADPDPSVWQRIAASLEQPEQRPAELDQVRRRLALWRGYSAAATALAASLLLVIGLRPEAEAPAPGPAPAAPQPVMVASLSPENGAVTLTASYDPATNSLVVAPAAVSPVPGHDHELWIVPEDGTPRSLGLIAAKETRRMALPALPRTMVETATIALSAEPAGGSPTGQPTGPIVASGKFVRI